MSSSSADTKPDEPARMDGPNSHVVDQLLGNDHRKRSRPTGSSLDYHKPVDAESLVTPGNRQVEQQDEQQENYHHQEDGRPKITTRARGSSGIPPPGKLTLDDLQGMSDDEIMRALYADPELAAAAAAASSQMGADKPAGAAAGKTSRTPKIGAQGKRVDELKERGFPFVQWAVLLLLLGLAFHQIYKSVMAPSTTASKSKTKKAKNGKAVKSKTKAASATIEEDVAELELEVTPPIQKSASAPKRNNVEKVAPKSEATQKKPAIVEQAVQDDGWTTVGKESDSKPKVEAKNGSSSKSTAKPVEAATPQEDTEINVFKPVSTNKKKKNKKTKENGNSSNHDADDVTMNGFERDAALAMELQQFEQRALQSETIENNIDVWEEVKPKKRK